MSVREVLLIGGPRDGERLEVEDSLHYLLITYTSGEFHRYERGKIRGRDGVEYVVYVADDIEPIDSLISGYRKSKETI
ncbi:hypothetical protein [Pseudomonas aeruginosa]|uniref:hypothetical protein n=1 Tax=Pseudomonas aeruginosa TaxID=287 RepID=UPI001D09CB36|nr:hypothetical protein [Pseudomonas aeruginosa]MCC0321256.1 hypothetical protein [Pseudomonas aeruginosa]